MIHKLQHKIFVGVLLLAILLTAAGTMILYQYLVLNKSVGALLDDNYKTIRSCQHMIDALERQDSGILLLWLGNWEKGREIIEKADSSFMAAFEVVQTNLTETNEDQYVGEIRERYVTFKTKWERPIVGTVKERNIEWYTEEIHNSFLKTKESVYALMALNQESMYSEANSLKSQTYRTIMPGLVAVGAVIVFAFTFNFFLSQSLLVPLRKLIKSTREFSVNLRNFNPNLKSNDEFKELENEIRRLIERTK